MVLEVDVLLKEPSKTTIPDNRFLSFISGILHMHTTTPFVLMLNLHTLPKIADILSLLMFESKKEPKTTHKVEHSFRLTNFTHSNAFSAHPSPYFLGKLYEQFYSIKSVPVNLFIFSYDERFRPSVCSL